MFTFDKSNLKVIRYNYWGWGLAAWPLWRASPWTDYPWTGSPSSPKPRKPGAKDRTPEINTSEIIVDCQWYFPTDCQLHFPIEFHLSLVSGISQGIVTCPVDVYRNCPMDFQWHFPTNLILCEIWCVIVCPEKPVPSWHKSFTKSVSRPRPSSSSQPASPQQQDCRWW